MSKQCFVIMPFKQPGTPEHAHYRALFDNVLKPAIEKFGFEVIRADDHKRVGSITKDIIVPLANAELVVADLTEVNPNVFYELGVRHALRGYGTIMIMDESQTAIPFDITAYRVIKFKSTLEGIGLLGRELSAYVQQLETDPTLAIRDNLVHDWLPSLPTNVLQSSLGSEEGLLRKQVQELRKTISTYEDKYGAIGATSEVGPTAHQLVADALAEAKAGHVASKLVETANAAAAAGDTTEYLTALSTILQLRTSRPSTRHLMELMHGSKLLGLDSIEEALVEHSHKLYPNNRELRLVQFGSFAHSPNPSSRARARKGMLEELGIVLTDTDCKLSKPFKDEIDFGVLGMMLDAFHQDQLHADALRLLAPLIVEYPENSYVIRNYARALENVGDEAKGLEYYRKAILLPDADDTSAIWFGNELHNRRRHVDAAEAYLIAAIKDPDDPAGLVHFADDISMAMSAHGSNPANSARELPRPIEDCRALVAGSLAAAIAIGGMSPDVVGRLRSTAKRAEVDVDDLDGYLPEGGAMLASRTQRAHFVKSLYEIFRSELTHPLPTAINPESTG